VRAAADLLEYGVPGGRVTQDKTPGAGGEVDVTTRPGRRREADPGGCFWVATPRACNAVCGTEISDGKFQESNSDELDRSGLELVVMFYAINAFRFFAMTVWAEALDVVEFVFAVVTFWDNMVEVKKRRVGMEKATRCTMPAYVQEWERAGFVELDDSLEHGP